MKRESAGGHAVTTLSTLPEDLLLQILSLLSARDLAALSVQDCYLRHVASNPSLWQPLALARWPGADAADQYGGDWHALYLARAPLPLAFPLAADRVRAITAAQQRRQEQQQAAAAAAAVGVPGTSAGAEGSSSSSAGAAGGSMAPAAALVQAPALDRLAGGRGGQLPGLAFEEVMRQVFSVGLACGMDRAVKRTAEWRGLKSDLTWWASQRPEVVVAFVRGANELLGGAGGGSGGGWGGSYGGGAAALGGGGGRGWTDTPWRRSAVAYLQALGLLSGAHASVTDRVAAEAAALDRAIRSVQRQASTQTVAAPQGVPASHWWFG